LLRSSARRGGAKARLAPKRSNLEAKVVALTSSTEPMGRAGGQQTAMRLDVASAAKPAKSAKSAISKTSAMISSRSSKAALSAVAKPTKPTKPVNPKNAKKR
jgi:hypothetical protein